MRVNTLRRNVPSIIIAISITALVVLFVLIGQKVNLLRDAPADNVTWGLSQVEVDLLTLRSTVLTATEQADADVAHIKRRFDNAYSRVSNLEKGLVFAAMRKDAEFAETLADLQGAMDGLIPLIDGPDDDLRAGLPDMLPVLDRLDQSARALALSGIALNSQSSDANRESFYQLLTIAAAITFALIVFLIVMSYLQVRQYRAFRRVSRDVEKANTRLNSSFQASLDAIVVADDQGIILEFNEAAEGVFGYTRQEAVGGQMADLIVPPHLRDAHLAGMQRFLDTKEPHLVGKGRIEIVAMRKSGEEFPVELAIGQADDPGGTIFISYLRDITKRLQSESDLKQARDDALQAERAKSNFLAVMSHEMRTPLNGIFGTIELMRKTKLEPNQTEYLDIAQQSGEILLNHVNDVLDITRIDAGELTLSENVFNLRKFFENVIKTNEPTAIPRGNQLVLRADGLGHLWVSADEQRLRQVAFNLISNALKFTDEGTVTLSADATGKDGTVDLTFKVTDTGVGIPDKDQAKVFDRFFTQGKSYDRMASGTGLGLAICKQIIEKMDGVISVDSAVGQGSTFTVTVPLQTAQERSLNAARHVTELQGQSLSGAQILLVEDNEINRNIVREMLESEGALVTEAINGQEAVRVAGGDRFSAILMDISMPVMNGVDATRQIRSQVGLNKETPILALTAHAMAEEHEQFMDAGMQGCLNKPVSQSSLALALRDVIGRIDAAQAPDHAPHHHGLVDADIFNGLKSVLKQEKLETLIHKFDAEVVKIMADLPAHLEADSLTALGDLCHRSVGSAGMMGALSFQAELRKLEQAARNGDVTAAQDAAQDVTEAWPKTRTALMNQL